MGYHAYANAWLDFREDADIEKVVKDVIPKVGGYGLLSYVRLFGIKDKDGNYRSAVNLVVEYEGNYHYEEVEAALELIAPYVKLGSEIFFEGDDAKWSYELEEASGKWVERQCYDYYECDLDNTAQFVIQRQGFPIGLTNEELKKIYEAIGRGEISIDEEEEK